MTLPNFFIVGAAKCGTTSLASYLNQHPDIFIPDIKEPKFFSVEDNKFPHNGVGDKTVDAKVIKTWDEYEAIYKGAKDEKAVGDASVDYLYFPKVAMRLYKYNPNSKIIIVLRDPVERAYSAYMHLVRDGREKMSFGEALNLENNRLNNNWEFFWDYTGVSMYSQQVKRYMELFDCNNIMILLFENFTKNPGETIKNIFKFLDVSDNINVATNKIHNVSGAPKHRVLHFLLNKPNVYKSILKFFVPPSIRKQLNLHITKKNLVKSNMSDKEQKILRDRLFDDVCVLQSLIKLDLSVWKSIGIF